MNLKLLISTVGFEVSITAIVVNTEKEDFFLKGKKKDFINKFRERKRRGVLSNATGNNWVWKTPRIYGESRRIGNVF